MSNTVIWITGASYGIGAALAKIYAQRGVKLILSARRISALEKIKSECLTPENIKIMKQAIQEKFTK